MNKPELEALLAEQDRRGLCWATISTDDLRELLRGYREPPLASGGIIPGSFDPESFAAAIRAWPSVPFT